MDGLYVEGADDPLTHLEWQSHFRTSFWQQRILEVHGVGVHSGGDVRLTGAGGVAHDADLSHFQLVPALQHLATDLAGGRPQDGILAPLIHQKDTGVIESKTLSDQIDGPVQQFAHVARGGGVAGHLSRHLELHGPAFQFGGAPGHALFQFLGVALHLFVQAGLLDGNRQLVGQFSSDVHVLGNEGAGAFCPQVEDADQFTVGDEG